MEVAAAAAGLRTAYGRPGGVLSTAAHHALRELIELSPPGERGEAG